ncbi:nitroreductase family protein [Dokdonia sp. Hel_I_53]|uniref:nitroreductase family protein n=1 Tax=Dokdonia sp. Hel_I_53 TaxID=1566287 RepID=UPI00119A211E|nr:nitroreductase family protein [Dokdonia sp. Hel_I_53]TVZ51617.1 nitroreductase [Dokdonia sp. Hel_I_53]
MTKAAQTSSRILPQITDRWSPRVFGQETIDEELLRMLFEAGRWAPSSNNLQPWLVIWGIKGTKQYDRIFDCLDEFNQSWAGNSQALILCGYKKTNPEGKENFHALHDLGLFMGNVSAQAQHLGVALHQMAGVDYKKAMKEFNVPDDFHIATATAIGYYGGDLEKLPEDLQKEETKKRSRKEQTSFTFNGDFDRELFTK